MNTKKLFGISMTVSSITLLVLSVLNPTALKARIGNKYATCSGSITFEQAQENYSKYLQDPIANEIYKNLDGDGDGIACENLKK